LKKKKKKKIKRKRHFRSKHPKKVREAPTSGYACAHPFHPSSGDLRSLRVTFHNVTSSQKVPLGRILRNFRCGCAHPREPRRGHVISGSPIGHAQWYYYNSSSAKCTGCACARDRFR